MNDTAVSAIAVYQQQSAKYDSRISDSGIDQQRSARQRQLRNSRINYNGCEQNSDQRSNCIPGTAVPVTVVFQQRSAKQQQL